MHSVASTAQLATSPGTFFDCFWSSWKRKKFYVWYSLPMFGKVQRIMYSLLLVYSEPIKDYCGLTDIALECLPATLRLRPAGMSAVVSRILCIS